MYSVVIPAIKAHGFRLNSLFHKADCFIQRDCRFVWHVHLQVDAMHPAIESVLKYGFYKFSAQSSATIPR
jgi:hypothetical protein